MESALDPGPWPTLFCQGGRSGMSCARKRVDVLPGGEVETNWKPSMIDNTYRFSHHLDTSGNTWVPASGKPNHPLSNGKSKAHIPACLLCGFSYTSHKPSPQQESESRPLYLSPRTRYVIITEISSPLQTGL